MSKHKITTELAVSFPGTDPTETETAHPGLEDCKEQNSKRHDPYAARMEKSHD